MADFKLKATYSFDVFPTSVIGNNYQNVTVLAIMDRETVDKEINAQALHIQCFPFLPPGTPDSPDGYDYIKIRMSSGQVTYLGMAWINEATIQSNDYRTLTAVITGVTSNDAPRVKAALLQNGFPNFTLSLSA